MSEILDEARRVLEIEARSILEVKERLNGSFEAALDILFECQGKVIFAGIGKSGHIARKLASTMSSTGTPALYLHPAESSHGDLGVIGQQDCIIIISNGGESPELKDLIGYVMRKDIPMIAMTGNLQSHLAKSAKAVLDIKVSEEACPMGLAPTSSTTVTLALGDALAVALLKKKGFRKEDFAEFHPGGSLGRRLLTRVSDVMHGTESLPLVAPNATIKAVVPVMTAKEVRGVVGVINEAKELIGIVTDGDIRRLLDTSKDPLNCKVEDIMSRNPKTIFADEMAEKALFVMEQFTIQMLFVLDKEQGKKPVGILHLQDLLKAKIR
ncbi:MAG: KpsF/GutQ family sugar-phosphate isomerase [Bdellovibrionaceae bacterium]|nr:KpsF/GutQ family sugar-phosphate isomerase [Pseudobdellovibrionaceae bacterium]